MNLVPVEQMSAAAQWLNETFATFDYSILEFYYNLHSSPIGGILDVFFEIYTRLGDEGILFIVLSLIMMLFKKTRKLGFGMLGGIIVGALFTNITIKPLVARPRPYATTETFYNWWNSVAHGLESEFSVPSGHTTSTAAALFPVFLGCNKKKSWIVFPLIVLMGASRNYILVHYPSDILGGIIIGCLAGFIAYMIFEFLYNKIFPKGKLGNMIINADLAEVLKKKTKKA